MPDEPATILYEARAEAVDQELRCMVTEPVPRSMNQAPLARDLRKLVRGSPPENDEDIPRLSCRPLWRIHFVAASFTSGTYLLVHAAAHPAGGLWYRV